MEPVAPESPDARRAGREAAGREEAARRAAQNEDLDATRSSLNRQKTVDSLKRFSYLLGQTELFQHFVDMKRDRDAEFAKLLDESQARRGRAARASASDTRHRKSEREEDEELLQDGEEDEFMFRESPAYVKGGTMRCLLYTSPSPRDS